MTEQDALDDAEAGPVPADEVSPDLGQTAPRGLPRPANANGMAGQPPMRRQGRRLLAASSAAVVVVVAAVAATWLVRQGDDAAARGPDVVQTGALDSPGPATPSGPPSSAPPATTMTVTASPSGSPSAPPTADTGTGATAETKPGTPRTRHPAAPATVRDDFAGSTLAGRWNPYKSAKDNGGVWLPSQVRVRAGELQIVGQGTDPTGKGNRSGGLCWCSAGGDQLYGVWKIRAKFDAGAGYGQGIGLWPASDDGAADGNITLAISDAAGKDSSWHALIAPGGKSKGSSSPGNFAAWHVYAVQWRATFVRISIDGKAVFDSRQNAPGLAIPHTPLGDHEGVEQIVVARRGEPADPGGVVEDLVGGGPGGVRGDRLEVPAHPDRVPGDAESGRLAGDEVVDVAGEPSVAGSVAGGPERFGPPAVPVPADRASRWS